MSSRSTDSWLDPFELLDLHGQGEYDRGSVGGMALGAQRLAHAMYGDMLGRCRQVIESAPDQRLLIRGAVQSISATLTGSRSLLQQLDVQAERARALRGDAQVLALTQAQEALGQLQDARDALSQPLTVISTAQAIIEAPDPPLPALEPADKASKSMRQAVAAYVRLPLDKRRNSLFVLNSTPGLGKTEAIVQEARALQREGKRVMVSPRTKSMVRGPGAELTKRLAGTGGIGDVVALVGREDYEDPVWGRSCHNYAQVELAAAQGYMPGRAVCSACEHYPSNASATGLSICGYYQSRITAHLLSRRAAQGARPFFPILLSPHATLVATAKPSGGGRYGSMFKNLDMIFVDEDPTDAMRTEIVLTAEQCGFRAGGNVDRRGAELIARVLETTAEMADAARKKARANEFKSATSDRPNSHEAHNSHGSALVGEQLHVLVQAAANSLGVTAAAAAAHASGPMGQQGFSVAPGLFLNFRSIDEVNRNHVPPVPLMDVAAALHAELIHARNVQMALHSMLSEPDADPNADFFADPAELAARRQAALPPDLKLSHQLRLECVDEKWRFVVSQQHPLHVGDAAIVIGDAYATREHYERLFPDRQVEFSEHIAQLHPQAHIRRFLDRRCTAHALDRGDLQRVLGLMQADLKARYRPGDRVFVYCHSKFRDRVVASLRGLAEELGMTDEQWAFEHWWGGRGKDVYKGWEHGYCLSDPIPNLRALEHVVNAQRFRAAERAMRRREHEQFLALAERVRIGDLSHGVAAAVANSDPWLRTEAFRQSSAELVQALHRGRPVREPVSATAFGATPLTPDLLAQTDPRIAGDANCAGTPSESGRIPLTLASLENWASPEELLSGIDGIVNHYGVFSAHLWHALMHFGGVGSGQGSSLLSSSCVKESHSFNYVSACATRVWFPPMHWAQLMRRDTLPFAARAAMQTLPQCSEYERFKPGKLPPWMRSKGGPRPFVYYKPELCAQNVAEQLFFELMGQYGHVHTVAEQCMLSDGTMQTVLVERLDRPHFNPEMPPSLKAFRDEAPF